MRSLSHFFYRGRGRILENFAKNKISKLKDGEYRLANDIPYVSQYELLDPFWAPKLCGMACFKMILLSLGNSVAKWKNTPLIELGKGAMAAGCYEKDPANPKRLIGMLHAPFLNFAEEYGLKGKLIWYIGANAVAGEILKNKFVIASVANQIRHAGARPRDKTGHLVLVHGFQVTGGEVKGFYIHNPSGENHFVPVKDFTNCFSGRIIALWKK